MRERKWGREETIGERERKRETERCREKEGKRKNKRNKEGQNVAFSEKWQKGREQEWAELVS